MSEKFPSDSGRPNIETAFKYKKPKSFFPESSVERIIALALFALLLLMAFGLGYLVASNKISAWFIIQRSLPRSSTWRYFDDEFIFPILGIVLGVFLLKFCYNVFRRIPTRSLSLLPGLGITLLVGCVFLADEDTNMVVVAAFCFLFAVYTLSGPPLAVTIFMLIFYAIGLFLTAGAGMGMFIGLLAIGLSMYPSNISINRLIRPKRGVI